MKTYCNRHNIRKSLVKGKLYCGDCIVGYFDHLVQPMDLLTSLFKRMYEPQLSPDTIMMSKETYEAYIKLAQSSMIYGTGTMRVAIENPGHNVTINKIVD